MKRLSDVCDLHVSGRRGVEGEHEIGQPIGIGRAGKGEVGGGGAAGVVLRRVLLDLKAMKGRDEKNVRRYEKHRLGKKYGPEGVSDAAAAHSAYKAVGLGGLIACHASATDK